MPILLTRPQLAAAPPLYKLAVGWRVPLTVNGFDKRGQPASVAAPNVASSSSAFIRLDVVDGVVWASAIAAGVALVQAHAGFLAAQLLIDTREPAVRATLVPGEPS
jgi:hypothetical protein